MREQPVLSNGIEEVTRPRGSLGLRRDPAGRGGRQWLSAPGAGLLLVGDWDQEKWVLQTSLVLLLCN